MSKTTLIKILSLSVGITIGLSILFGLAGSTIIGTFWGWFWLSFLGQVVVFALANSYFLQKDSIVVQQIENEALDKLSKFTIRLSCAYCGTSNTLPIILGQKNTFVCESCNQTNSVSINFMATTITTPIESLAFSKLESKPTETNPNSIVITKQ